MSKEIKTFSGVELKNGHYYLRVFTDIYDDKTMHYVRRGIEIHVSGLVARSLKAVLKKVTKQGWTQDARYVNGLPLGYVEPLQRKRYRADINLCLSKWTGERFEDEAGFMGF